MRRRHLIRAIGGGAALRAAWSAGAAPQSLSPPPAHGDSEILALQARMAAGQLTAVALARRYLARIGALDRRGPQLRAVIEINPDAVAIATALDRERRERGPRGPLHGIPVLLKDNLATADTMSTSAGSLALDGVRAAQDSTVAQRLRAAGAVILGKTNLSEWANIRSAHSTSGWSGRGGLTRNPHALDRSASGSSSGSAVAVAADLAVAAIGSETDGSIVSPASSNGVVGIKPTVGLVSRHGIVPISASQDTAGPIARTVGDAALVLDAIAGADPHDAATAAAPAPPAAGYGVSSGGEPLRGVRLGLVRDPINDNERVAALVDRAVHDLAALGATVVEPIALPGSDKYGDAELLVLLAELKAGLNAYLPQFLPSGPVSSLADVIDYNRREHAREMRYFPQDLFLKSQASTGLDDPAYRDARALCLRLARDEGIDRALAEHQLDALIAPTGGPPCLIDLVDGDGGSVGSFSTPAAVAGYPHVTVPAGFVHGLPIGLSFVGPAYSEEKLIGFAIAYERATGHRRAPSFAPTARLE